MLAISIWLSLVFTGGTSEGAELIGTRPPDWEVTDWMNSAPLTLTDLRGRVVVVRWWTAPDCPFCRATAPSLNSFHREYSSRGLVIIGFYHHKSPGPLRTEDVQRQAGALGFQFPLAVDREWKTLKKWWLDGWSRRWTSVTFLIDRQGVIRYIHPGGQYVQGDADHASLQAHIEAALRRQNAP